MTATAEGTPTVAPRRAKSKEKSSIWSMDIGHKTDDEVAHPAFVPTLPRVNLLPAAILQSYTLRRIRRSFIALAILLVAAFAGVWWLQGQQIADAQDALDRAESNNAAVAGKVTALDPIKQMYQQITGEQGLVSTTLAAQPQAAIVINRLAQAGSAAANAGGPVQFTAIAIEYRGVPEAGGELNPCPNPDPFSTAITIGCVTFSGTATSRDQVSSMLSQIAADPLFVGAYVNNSTVNEPTSDSPGGVMFSGTVGISTEALVQKLTPEQVQAITTPPAPASPAATP